MVRQHDSLACNASTSDLKGICLMLDEVAVGVLHWLTAMIGTHHMFSQEGSG